MSNQISSLFAGRNYLLEQLTTCDKNPLKIHAILLFLVMLAWSNYHGSFIPRHHRHRTLRVRPPVDMPAARWSPEPPLGGRY